MAFDMTTAVLAALVVVLTTALIWTRASERRAAARAKAAAEIAASAVTARVVSAPIVEEDAAMTRAGTATQTLRIQMIKNLSYNTRLFRLELPAPDASLPRAGHLSVIMQIHGVRVVRSYTPITTPSVKGYVDLVIKKYEYGTVTPELFNLSVGDSITVRGPFGRRLYRKGEAEAVLLLGGGTGLTPLLQTFLCALEDPEDTTRFVLMYQNRTDSDILLRDKLRELEQEHSNRFKVVHVLTRPGANWGRTASELSGYVDAAKIRQIAGGCTIALMCGPTGFMDSMDTQLQSAGISTVRRF